MEKSESSKDISGPFGSQYLGRSVSKVSSISFGEGKCEMLPFPSELEQRRRAVEVFPRHWGSGGRGNGLCVGSCLGLEGAASMGKWQLA